MNLLKKIIIRLSENSEIFNVLRKILEINFIVQKKLIKKQFGNLEGKKILDIGCGTGEFADQFEKAYYYGIDIFPEYIEHAKKTNKGKFAVMDATDLRFSDQEFDAVLIMAILHHLDDETTRKVLAEARRVTKPGGRILIMEDAKIKSFLNFITKPIQALDKGDFIRTAKEYQSLIAPYFEIDKQGEFRSGAITYAYFLLR